MTYSAPRRFANRHLTTIYAARVARAPSVAYRRERWDTPDGDFIDLDFVDGPIDAPRVVLFHGLEGSSQSTYARSIMSAIKARGWRGVVPHFRGCSGEMNRKPRSYHSGDSPEADWILRRLVAGDKARPVYAAGVSLGGNVLVKWLGEQGAAAREFVTRAAVVSTPVDLKACADALERGFTIVYAWNFLHTLKRAARKRLALFPGIIDARAMERARTLRAFDDAVTAPLHGYTSADDYYVRSSCKPLLPRVEVPLLLLNASDDPFLPEAALPTSAEHSKYVRTEFSDRGGHVGFVDDRGGLNWLPKRLLAFFDEET